MATALDQLFNAEIHRARGHQPFKSGSASESTDQESSKVEERKRHPLLHNYTKKQTEEMSHKRMQHGFLGFPGRLTTALYDAHRAQRLKSW